MTLPPLPAFLALLALSALCACTAQQIDIRPTPGAQFAAWTDEAPAHRLGPGDEVELRFLLNTELNDRAIIGPDGRATVPLLGPVPAAGLTVERFAAALRRDYAPKLRVPDLDVAVRSFASSRIYVGGEVNNPGVAVLQGRVNALQGVLLAGGMKNTARTGEVVVIRRSPDDKPMLRTVNLKRLIGQGDPSQDFPLAAGDVVFVPRSDIAEADLFVEQYINQLVPFSRNLNFGMPNY